MKMDLGKWIFLVTFSCLCVVKYVLGAYCAYNSTSGVTKFAHCTHICCEGADITFDNICCQSAPTMYVTYIGVGMTIAAVAIVIVYTFNRKRCSQMGLADTPSSRSNEELPTVSFNVHPPEPPPYISKPPDYCQLEVGTSIKVEEWFTTPKEEPPPYSLYDTTT